MADEYSQITVSFPLTDSIRELLKGQELAQYPMGRIAAVVVSSRRLSAVMQYLHKPSGKPETPPGLPGGSIFRGMVFGNIGIFTNRDIDKEQASVLLRPESETKTPPPPPPHQFTARGPIETPESAAAKQRVKMVGMPGQKDKPAPEAAPASGPQSGETMDRSITQDLRFFSGAQPPAQSRAPSGEKLKRWTEIIPSGTRIRRPAYPGQPDESAAQNTAPPSAPASPGAPAKPVQAKGDQAGPSQETVELPFDSAPAELGNEDRIHLAKEADRLIADIIALIEANRRLAYDMRSDLVAEMRMLQLELDKFRPGVVRVTEMIMNVSPITETQTQIARLKECLRSLGLLL